VKTPSVGAVVTVVLYSRVVRATIRRSYKKRFIAATWVPSAWALLDDERVGLGRTESGSFERSDEGRTWVRGWDTVDAIAFRAEKALAACQ